ncbi:MAG: transcription antitermination factor NusB [Deltaproteobacteria bacterium]|jgi:N utilization substance protein B|nr:transcription antitermination factor NusB [Deltaproteobacteria bacterium]
MSRRRRSREMAIQVLYQVDMARSDINEALRLFCEHFKAPDSIRDFAVELANGVDQYREEIDTLIRRFSEHWRLERMSAVDRNILRLAIFELLYRADIPAKVSINEAVDLGKKYGSEDSGSFINGILDRIRVDLEEGTLKVATAPEQRLGDPTRDAMTRGS